MKLKAILIFDPCSDGHHAGYILNLFRYLHESGENYLLQLLVTEQFTEQHIDVVDYAREHLSDRVNWWTLSDQEAQSILKADSTRSRATNEWRVLSNYCSRIKHDTLLHMYADYIVYALAFKRKLPKPMVGLIFRQNPHYSSMFGTKLTLREQIMAKSKAILLQRSMRNSSLQKFLCLDPYLPEYFKNNEWANKLAHCPDPVYVEPGQSEQMPDILQFHASSKRKHLLLFGVISKRKGFAKFLEEAAALSPEYLSQLCFHVAGPTMEPEEESRLNRATTRIESQGGRVIRENHFIKDHEIPGYFNASDYIIAPYEKHIGMSAILVRAAMANKPVIASDYGLMGKIVNNYRLGTTFGPTRQQNIIQAIENIVFNESIDFDPEGSKCFREDNEASLFGKTIFGHCLTPRDTNLRAVEEPDEIQMVIEHKIASKRA